MKDVPEFGLDVRYSYDLRGLQTGAWFTGTGHGVYNAYDGFGRVTSTTSTMGGVTRTISHMFDREGREAELTFPDGFKFWFERDGLGRMTKARQGAWGTGGPVMASFGYNAKGLPASFTRGAGNATSYGYDSALRLNLLTDTFAGGTGNVATDFTYNPASQLRSEFRNNDDYAWRGAVPVARTYWVNGQNQYLQTASNGAVSATFTHDPNGNLTGDGSTNYTYDSENRLVTASGGKTATLAYDPLGRLWQVTGASGTTQFLHDGDELVAEYSPQGNVLRRYVHGDAADDPLFWFEGFDLTHARFPHGDRKGSIVATADGTGALRSINTYDEYGIPGGLNQGRFQYTGQAWLAELGMYYYKARIYSPTLGRFLQTDPIGYEDQINLYAYVGNDPANQSDSTGQWRDIYVGGGGDSIHRTVKSYAERQQVLHPNRDIRYFSYSDTREIDHAMQEPLKPGEPLNVIAHSWGASTAINRAEITATYIDNLITIDPVGFINPGAELGNVANWTNVMASPSPENRNLSDIIASIGRGLTYDPQAVLDKAHTTIESGQNHRAFRSMMNEAEAPKLIEESYKNTFNK